MRSGSRTDLEPRPNSAFDAESRCREPAVEGWLYLPHVVYFFPYRVVAALAAPLVCVSCRDGPGYPPAVMALYGAPVTLDVT